MPSSSSHGHSHSHSHHHYGVDVAKSSSPTRARHRLTRSITETSHPAKHRHHPSIHRRDREQAPAAGTLQPAAHDFAKSEGGTPNVSRRTSVLGSVGDGSEPSTRERIVPDGEIQEEKQRTAQRAGELTKTLEELHALSHSETRRLDNTYYSILEKLGTLQTTLASMKEISAAAKRLNADFIEETQEISHEIQSQLEHYEAGLNDKEKRAHELVARIENSQAKARALNERMSAIKTKVESWEAAEQDWQDKTRMRLRMLWVIISATVLILVVLLIFEYSPVRGTSHLQATPRWKAIENLTDIIPPDEHVGNESATKRSIADVLGITGKDEEDDGRLKVFDEL